jgi:predicted DNA-binding transcriptional regulator AlpA
MRTRAICPDQVPVKPIYSIKEFCCQHGISRSLLYKLLQSGHGPRVIKAGKRTLITNDAAVEWRRNQEQARVR